MSAPSPHLQQFFLGLHSLCRPGLVTESVPPSLISQNTQEDLYPAASNSMSLSAPAHRGSSVPMVNSRCSFLESAFQLGFQLHSMRTLTGCQKRLLPLGLLRRVSADPPVPTGHGKGLYLHIHPRNI